MVSAGLLIVSLLILGAGVYQMIWPEIIASHKQRWDAIQNRHGSEREQDWIVTYTRRGGGVLVGIGVFLLALSIDAL